MVGAHRQGALAFTFFCINPTKHLLGLHKQFGLQNQLLKSHNDINQSV